jgi:AraC-like DNA-binding protein
VEFASNPWRVAVNLPAPADMISVLNHELLNALDLRVLTVQRVRAGRWWNFRQVISPFSRLWLVLGGKATVCHHGRRFVLRPGRIHLVPAFTMHDCSCASRFDHYHLHFVARMPTGIDLFSLLDSDYDLPAEPMLDLFQELERIYPERKLPCFDPNREEYRRLPATLTPAVTPEEALKGFAAGGALRLLLAPFLRTARSHEGVHARVNRQFLAVQEFIQANMRRQIALADLARVADLHPTYFSDQFKRMVGVRPLDYLLRRRIERAQYLLLTTRAPIKEVADAVGIPDPAYFSRVFSKLCRVAPTAYRGSHGA